MAARIRKGDTVEVLARKNRGTRGQVLSVDAAVGKVTVERVNVVKRHTRPTAQYRQGGIVEKEKGVYLAEGYVDLRHGNIRLQADWALFDRANNHVEARGNVVLDQEGGTLSASRMEMSLETGKGTLWEVTGFQPPDYHFRARRMERIDDTHYKIYGAEFTTCTQPTPYWSFRFKKGHIHVNKYAHLINVSFRASKVPVFYSPYVVWPIKGDRATGFYMRAGG